MALVIISQKSNQQDWVVALKSLEPDLDVRVYPEDTKRGEVEFALVWHPPPGIFKHYPNIKCIASTGAGVDHILKDPDLPKSIEITRVIDNKLTHDMTSYLIAQVMCHVRNISEYNLLQTKQQWQPRPYEQESRIRIGIMGMGELGKDVGFKLNQLGYKVHGWVRTAKKIDNIEMFVGNTDFKYFLGQSDILICLLPLTSATSNILNSETFGLLPKGAYVINVARGEHLVEADLVDSIDSGKLAGACLDVFREEPLPKGHIFWRHPKITVTPHIASITNLQSVASQIIENYRRLRENKPLQHTISRSVGY